MMSCEEAYLLGKYIRGLDAKAVLVLGPVPSSGEDEVFRHYLTQKETFRIKAEKVPNAAGIRRVLGQLGGDSGSFDDFVKGSTAALKNAKAGWIVGGYLSSWVPKDVPAQFKKGFRVLQDILPTSLSDSADVVLPAAAWAEKAGCWENYQVRVQAFDSAINPPEGARREGDVYYKLLGRTGYYSARDVRREMGEPFASVVSPSRREAEPAFEFVEL
jgi:NADH-quinone oxidoreductase subunit G